VSVCHPEWRDHAACRGQNMLRLFYPGQGEPTREAKQVCAGCVVRLNCLEHAMDHPERFGVWGGLSEQERRVIRIRRGDAA
jgi:WhiB family redox-sensing transcriptional regulator